MLGPSLLPPSLCAASVQLVFSVCGTCCPHLCSTALADRVLQSPPLTGVRSSWLVHRHCQPQPLTSACLPSAEPQLRPPLARWSQQWSQGPENSFAGRCLHVSICVQLQLTDSLAFTAHTSHNDLVFWALSRSPPWALFVTIEGFLKPAPLKAPGFSGNQF